MNRGSTDAAKALWEMANRFNEAPIHESGKSTNDTSTSVAAFQLQ